MSKKEKKDNNTNDRIIQIILIIIIILLLLQNCSLIKEKGNEENDKVNTIDIKNNNGNCPQGSVLIDCLEDEQNSKCVVPNFVGKNKKDVYNWVNSISNNIQVEIILVENPNYKDGIVLEQSVVGVSIKSLLENKQKIIIKVVNNGSLVDCKNNNNNSKCILPNFVGKSNNDVDEWISEIANHIIIRYVYKESDEPFGTVLSQSIIEGTNVNDITEKNQILIIYISRGKNSTNSSNDNNTNDNNNTNNDNNTSEDSQNSEEEFYVNDDEKVKWQNDADLKIFEDSTNISKVKGKIAPESSGTYKFVVNNETKYNLNYKITFTEKNEHNINMKYKLRKGNDYIIDHYVSCDSLNINNILLSTKSSSTYYLEWKWVGDNDDNDTSIGKSATSSTINYDLKINVEAESE